MLYFRLSYLCINNHLPEVSLSLSHWIMPPCPLEWSSRLQFGVTAPLCASRVSYVDLSHGTCLTERHLRAWVCAKLLQPAVSLVHIKYPFLPLPMPPGGAAVSCCCLGAQSCLTLCDPMNCSTPVFPVLHYFPEFTQTHVNPTISFYVVPFSSCLQCFPSTGSFPMLQLFPSDGPSIEASGSASVLPMSIQGWFPWGMTNLISLLFKGFSRVFSSTIVQRHQFFRVQLFFTVQLSHPYVTTGKTIALNIQTFVG